MLEFYINFAKKNDEKNDIHIQSGTYSRAFQVKRLSLYGLSQILRRAMIGCFGKVGIPFLFLKADHEVDSMTPD